MKNPSFLEPHSTLDNLVTDPATAKSPPSSSKRFAFLVAAGILLSRIAGLIRDRVFAHYFGNSDAADVFKAALRIPNFLQNLFGEGVLSASFIPVYANLLARDDKEEARKTAGAVAALLTLSTSMLVLLGVLAAPWLIEAIAPGFHGEKRELTVLLVRILFPGAGLLVASAWCLGVLNSHRKFFISYTAPVLWNLAMIAGMIIFGPGRAQNSLVIITADRRRRARWPGERSRSALAATSSPMTAEGIVTAAIQPGLAWCPAPVRRPPVEAASKITQAAIAATHQVSTAPRRSRRTSRDSTSTSATPEASTGCTTRPARRPARRSGRPARGA